MAMKAMKVAKKSAAMKAAKAAKVAAPPKRTAMKAMQKQAMKIKHTDWAYVNLKTIPSFWVRIDHDKPNVRVTCYKELDPMVAIK